MHIYTLSRREAKNHPPQSSVQMEGAHNRLLIARQQYSNPHEAALILRITKFFIGHVKSYI